MNLRDIKKDIEYVLSVFIEDCVVCASTKPQHQEKISALVDEAVDLFNEFRDKAAAKVEGSKKTYFNNLSKEVLEKSNDLWSRLSKIVAE